MHECWLCKKPIKGKAERHHIFPRRYYRRGAGHRRNNIAKVHSTCHRRLHTEVENCRWKWWQFKREMEPLKYGEGIFAGD